MFLCTTPSFYLWVCWVLTSFTIWQGLIHCRRRTLKFACSHLDNQGEQGWVRAHWAPLPRSRTPMVFWVCSSGGICSADKKVEKEHNGKEIHNSWPTTTNDLQHTLQTPPATTPKKDDTLCQLQGCEVTGLFLVTCDPGANTYGRHVYPAMWLTKASLWPKILEMSCWGYHYEIIAVSVIKRNIVDKMHG